MDDEHDFGDIEVVEEEVEEEVCREVAWCRCNFDPQDMFRFTSPRVFTAADGTLQLPQVVGNITIDTLIRNTKQKVPKDILWQTEEERSSLTPLTLVEVLATVPHEDCCRTWTTCRTIMLKRTSKRVKEQVDKMLLSVVVRMCEFWRDRWRDRPTVTEILQIVMNQLPSMTTWCHLTTLELHGLSRDMRENTVLDLVGEQGTQSFVSIWSVLARQRPRFFKKENESKLTVQKGYQPRFLSGTKN